ncbi:MAG: OmpA family protein [Alphaproteobacteria bacterium]|nr:OmpA family protein [Alphaproteobacteria bacterium]
MIKKTCINIIGAGALILSTSSLAHAQFSDQDVAVDQNQNPVIDSRGNCVRTVWEQGYDECDNGLKETTVIKETKTIVSPARTLTREQRTVLFDFDKDNLDSEAQRNLNTLSSVLKSSEDVKRANIVGYADPIGTNNYNQALSERRAQAVKNYMANRGYLNTRVTDVRALGESDKFANCDSISKRADKIECLRPNRRVEVEIEFIE